MKERQETTSSSSLRSRSSSSGRDSNSTAVAVAAAAHNQTQHHQKAVKVGCMPGIFHLLSKYHTRRKFLTFGKKQERQIIIPSPPKPETTATTTGSITCQADEKSSSETAGRSSLEVPRSPAIPAEIRSSGSANSPRVVARLMGVEDLPATPLTEVSAVEKRMKILGALEKCDEDLKALKRIIDTVRGGSGAQTPPHSEAAAVDGGGERIERREIGIDEEKEEEREEEPSPVSVLDFHLSDRSPPLTGFSKRTPYGQRKKTLGSMSKISTTLTSVFLPIAKTGPPPINGRTTTTMAWSKAVVETVEEVCRDIGWGPRGEAMRFGLLIQDFIFKDLLEEIIKEMTMTMKIRMRMKMRRRSYDYGSLSSSRIIALPVQPYKRKLCF